MIKRFTMLAIMMMAFGCLAWSANVWYGVVSDSMCGAKHSRTSAAAVACVKKCVAGGASYVLVSKGTVYQVTPQDKFADFAGKRVRVHGALSGTTITADSVTPVTHKSRSKAATTGGM